MHLQISVYLLQRCNLSFTHLERVFDCTFRCWILKTGNGTSQLGFFLEAGGARWGLSYRERRGVLQGQTCSPLKECTSNANRPNLRTSHSTEGAVKESHHFLPSAMAIMRVNMETKTGTARGAAKTAPKAGTRARTTSRTGRWDTDNGEDGDRGRDHEIMIWPTTTRGRVLLCRHPQSYGNDPEPALSLPRWSSGHR
jgi:hypothetical protein